MVVFETRRLVVRQLLDADISALYEICSDPLVMRYVGNLQPYSYTQTHQVILEAHQSYQQHHYGSWAFVLKPHGSLIGYGGLELLPARDVPEVSYIFAPAYWGQGYASEVAAAIIDYSFSHYEVAAIGASFDPANQVSMRVASKIGMQYRATGYDEYNLPTVFYIIYRSEWLRS